MTEISETDILDQALAAASVRVPAGSASAAVALRHRLNRQRLASRKAVQGVLGPQAASPYDVLILSIDGEALVIRHKPVFTVEIEGEVPRPSVVSSGVVPSEPGSRVLVTSELDFAPVAKGLCEWCGQPAEGPYCSEEHRKLAERQMVETINKGPIV